MDRLHLYIEESIKDYNQENRLELARHIYDGAGLEWIYDDLEPWERRADYPELELLSAFEFLRPELSTEELQILKDWRELYERWRDDGIFFERYSQTASRTKYSWEDERKDSEKQLGRLIPRSHWWFWPDDKRGES